MKNLEQFKAGISTDLLMADLVVTRLELTENEIIVDIDTVDSPEHWQDSIEGIAVIWLLDLVKLPRPKQSQKQTFVFYMKHS